MEEEGEVLSVAMRSLLLFEETKSIHLEMKVIRITLQPGDQRLFNKGVSQLLIHCLKRDGSASVEENNCLGFSFLYKKLKKQLQ